MLKNSRFRLLCFAQRWELAHIYFTWRNLLLNSKLQKKMIGHRNRFQENDNLPLRRGPVVKKNSPFSNACALITRKFMHSRDAQCNTEEWP